MASPQKSRPEDWKDQYFKVLNELDDAERTSADKLGRLSRDLLAVLTTLRGIDKAFDRELDALATERDLHEPAVQTRLSSLVDIVDRHTLAANDGSPAAATDVAPPTAADAAPAMPLELLLDYLEVPRECEADLSSLRQQLTAASAKADELELVRTIAATLSDMLRADDAELIQGRDLLQTLIDHLSLPASAHERLAKITPRLQAAGEPAVVRSVAKDLAGFVVDYVSEMQTEIAELNAFLLTIKGRLNEVSGHIAHEQDNRQVSAAARRDLDDSVRRSLGDMRAQMDGTTDIDVLKQEIESQLAVIDTNVTSFVANESERASSAQEQSRALAERLATLETESETLRTKLAQARARAVRDPLTGLANRLAYNERVNAEFARFQRAGHPLSLVVLDIDRFKSINDSYGHQAGDRVLRHMARELQSQIRTQDFFGRYGGEEFVLILPDTARAGALELAEKLRQHMESCRFKYKDTPVQITISCGIAEFAAGESIDVVFRRTDDGLYAAKENGRNRCEALDA